jgi:hypothetical protein
MPRHPTERNSPAVPTCRISGLGATISDCLIWCMWTMVIHIEGEVASIKCMWLVSQVHLSATYDLSTSAFRFHIPMNGEACFPITCFWCNPLTSEVFLVPKDSKLPSRSFSNPSQHSSVAVGLINSLCCPASVYVCFELTMDTLRDPLALGDLDELPCSLSLQRNLRFASTEMVHGFRTAPWHSYPQCSLRKYRPTHSANFDSLTQMRMNRKGNRSVHSIYSTLARMAYKCLLLPQRPFLSSNPNTQCTMCTSLFVSARRSSRTYSRIKMHLGLPPCPCNQPKQNLGGKLMLHRA